MLGSGLITKAFNGMLAKPFRIRSWRSSYVYSDLKHVYKPAYAYRSPVCAGFNRWLLNVLLQCPIEVVDEDNMPVDHLFTDLVKYPADGMSYGSFMEQVVFGFLNHGFAPVLPLYNGSQLAGVQYVSPYFINSYETLIHNRSIDWMDGDYKYDLMQDANTDMIAQLTYSIREGTTKTPESPYFPATLYLMLDICIAEGAFGRWKSPIPGGLLSFKKNAEGVRITQDDLDKIDEKISAMRGLDAGEFIGLPTEFTLHEFRGETRRLPVTEYTNLAEERIGAPLLLHSAVASLGASFQNQVGATLSEEVRQSYVNGALPFLEKLASEMTAKMLHKWYTNSMHLKVRFNTAKLDYETAQNREASTGRNLDLMERLGVQREYIAQQEGIPVEYLTEFVPGMMNSGMDEPT